MTQRVADPAKSHNLLQATAFSDDLLLNKALDGTDLDAAAVNTAWAKANLGFDPRIGSEAVDRNSYCNVIAMCAGSEGDPRLCALLDACYSDAVGQFTLDYYQGRQLPAW